jgi:glycosyltransferase involved in cell wall biosynthesis
MSKKKVLLFSEWFEPAYKAGGPIRSCVNFTEHLSAYLDIYIFTGDSDLGETKTLEGIIIDQWVPHSSGAHIWYASPGKLKKAAIINAIQFIKPDFIYLNSVYSKSFTIDVLMAHRQLKSPAGVVLSVRGMLKPTALAIKPTKKKIFFRIAKWMGMHRHIHFHATNKNEADEVRAIFGNMRVSIADNFPSAILISPAVIKKMSGTVKLILVGRIHPIKNIDYLLEQLKYIKGSILLSIVGVREDEIYWKQCETIIRSLPDDKKVELIGELPHHALKDILAAHHLFVLPTKGENFGHAIAEALGNGRPVLISDQTPWQNLTEAAAGWVCPLSSPDCFQKALREAVDWDQSSFDHWCRGAREFALAKQNTQELVKQYLQIFN